MPEERSDPGILVDADVALAAGLDPETSVRESETRIARGWIWGPYLRTDGQQGRLVTCSFGAVVEVAVDLRPSSPTYRLWMSLLLDDVTHRTVWLPAGVAHGFQALTELARVSCWTEGVPGHEIEATIRHDDPELAVPWPLPVSGLAGRDLAVPDVALVEPLLSRLFAGFTADPSVAAQSDEERPAPQPCTIRSAQRGAP